MANETSYPSTTPRYFKRPIISGLGTSTVLTEAQSGSIVCMDRAAGSDIVLPAGCANGTTFEFVVTVTSTSVGYKVRTGAATELMVGYIVNCDTDSSDALAVWKSLVGTSNLSFTLGGADTTKGGIIGDRVVVTKVTSTKWEVVGQTGGTGTVATPFSTVGG
jgi:hypothetical protein